MVVKAKKLNYEVEARFGSYLEACACFCATVQSEKYDHVGLYDEHASEQLCYYSKISTNEATSL